MSSGEGRRPAIGARARAHAVARLDPRRIPVPGSPDLVEVVVMEALVAPAPEGSPEGMIPRSLPHAIDTSRAGENSGKTRDPHAQLAQPVVLMILNLVPHLLIVDVRVVV